MSALRLRVVHPDDPPVHVPTTADDLKFFVPLLRRAKQALKPRKLALFMSIRDLCQVVKSPTIEATNFLLCRESGLTERTLYRALAVLETGGWIERNSVHGRREITLKDGTPGCQKCHPDMTKVSGRGDKSVTPPPIKCFRREREEEREFVVVVGSEERANLPRESTPTPATTTTKKVDPPREDKDPEMVEKLVAKAKAIFGPTVEVRIRAVCRSSPLAWVDAALDRCETMAATPRGVGWPYLTTLLASWRAEGGPPPLRAVGKAKATDPAAVARQELKQLRGRIGDQLIAEGWSHPTDKTPEHKRTCEQNAARESALMAAIAARLEAEHGNG